MADGTVKVSEPPRHFPALPPQAFFTTTRDPWTTIIKIFPIYGTKMFREYVVAEVHCLASLS